MNVDKVDNREPAALVRLLVRSALLGALVPVARGEFWEVKVVQIVSALVLCLVLYGLEQAIRWPLRNRVAIKPLTTAAYRGASLYGLLIFVTSGDWASALGGGIGGALAAMLLFALEEWVVKLFAKRRKQTSNGALKSDSHH